MQDPALSPSRRRAFACLLALAAVALPPPGPGPVLAAGRGGYIERLLTGGDADGSAGAGAAPEATGRPAAPWDAGEGGQALGIENGFDPRYERQEIAYDGPYAPGTVVVDTAEKFLYLIEPGGRALRYGIGVGRPGFIWSGTRIVTRKAEWPDWRPPEEMLRRKPDLPRFVPGGPQNPLGARALYLGSTLFRIHGTNEPETIGHNVSSGCIRLRNEDVIDLYSRVPVGTPVVVL